jgi:copper oxidase (laccase) domain-containing protein
VDHRIVSLVEQDVFDGLSNEKTHWDIAKACRGQLIQSGIIAEKIEFSGECTACNSQKYFSYKREGDRAGRMVAGAALSIKR